MCTDLSGLARIALLAGLALALAAAGASASRLSFDDLRTRTTTGNATTVTSSLGTLTGCAATFVANLNSGTFAKSFNALLADVDLLGFASCRGGSADLLSEETGISLRYNSFAGTLPRVSGVVVSLVGMRLRFEVEGASCLITTSEAEPLKVEYVVDTTTGVVDAIRFVETATIAATDVTENFCDLFGVEAALAGRSIIVEDGATHSIVVTLV